MRCVFCFQVVKPSRFLFINDEDGGLGLKLLLYHFDAEVLRKLAPAVPFSFIRFEPQN